MTVSKSVCSDFAFNILESLQRIPCVMNHLFMYHNYCQMVQKNAATVRRTVPARFAECTLLAELILEK